MPSVRLPVTRLDSTRVPSAARTSTPVPAGTPQTMSPASAHAFLRLFLVTTLCVTVLPRLVLTARPGSVKTRIPPVLPRVVLWSTATFVLFSTSMPSTFFSARL